MDEEEEKIFEKKVKNYKTKFCKFCCCVCFKQIFFKRKNKIKLWGTKVFDEREEEEKTIEVKKKKIVNTRRNFFYKEENILMEKRIGLMDKINYDEEKRLDGVGPVNNRPSTD